MAESDDDWQTTTGHSLGAPFLANVIFAFSFPALGRFLLHSAISFFVCPLSFSLTRDYAMRKLTEPLSVEALLGIRGEYEVMVLRQLTPGRHDLISSFVASPLANCAKDGSP